MDCGQYWEPWQMEFDHRTGVDKRGTVIQMASRNVKVMLEELAKCDVVCANCHNTRTYMRRNA